LFGRRAPLEIEVGSGKGLFLAQATCRCPEHDFLGIEISKKYASYSASMLAKRAIANGKVVHGDAVRVMSTILPDNSATAIHVYFPDPWWKQRHKKRRVMNGGFVQNIERVLRPAGTLHFWTDVHEYFQTTVDLIGQTTGLHGPVVPSESVPEHDMDFRTHFERRVRLEGEPVYRALFRKRNAGGTDSVGAD